MSRKKETWPGGQCSCLPAGRSRTLQLCHSFGCTSAPSETIVKFVVIQRRSWVTERHEACNMQILWQPMFALAPSRPFGIIWARANLFQIKSQISSVAQLIELRRSQDARVHQLHKHPRAHLGVALARPNGFFLKFPSCKKVVQKHAF